MFKIFKVKLNERVVVFKHGLPQRALGPGKHRLFGRGFTEQRWDTTKLVFAALLAVRALLPRDWFAEVTLGALERGVLFHDGHPVAFLSPGTHRYWTVDPSVKRVVYDTTEPLPALTRELEAAIPSNEYVAVTVEAHEKGLRFEQGRLTAVLEPGRYKLWTHPEAQVRVVSIDMRRTEVTIAVRSS